MATVRLDGKVQLIMGILLATLSARSQSIEGRRKPFEGRSGLGRIRTGNPHWTISQSQRPEPVASSSDPGKISFMMH